MGQRVRPRFEMEQLLTVGQVAEHLQVPTKTILRWIHTGKLPARIASRQSGYRIQREDLEAFWAPSTAPSGSEQVGNVATRTSESGGRSDGHEGPSSEPSGLHPAIQLIQSWLNGDDDEQRHTLDFLERALDEDRLSERPRFAE